MRMQILLDPPSGEPPCGENRVWDWTRLFLLFLDCVSNERAKRRELLLGKLLVSDFIYIYRER